MTLIFLGQKQTKKRKGKLKKLKKKKKIKLTMCRTPTFSIMMPMQVELSDNGACETGFECTKNSSSSSICVIEIFFNEFLFENSKKKKKED